MVIKLSFSRMSSSNQSVLVLKSASYRDIHSGPLLLKSWKFEILDNNDLAIRSKLASLIFRNSVKFSKYSQLSKLKMGHRKNFNFIFWSMLYISWNVFKMGNLYEKYAFDDQLKIKKLHKNAQFSNKGLFLKDLEVKIWSNRQRGFGTWFESMVVEMVLKLFHFVTFLRPDGSKKAHFRDFLTGLRQLNIPFWIILVKMILFWSKLTIEYGHFIPNDIFLVILGSCFMTQVYSNPSSNPTHDSGLMIQYDSCFKILFVTVLFSILFSSN